MRFWFFSKHDEGKESSSPTDRTFLKEGNEDPPALTATPMGYDRRDYENVYTFYWYVDEPPYLLTELFIKRNL